jgi:hypothetical protein
MVETSGFRVGGCVDVDRLSVYQNMTKIVEFNDVSGIWKNSTYSFDLTQ